MQYVMTFGLCGKFDFHNYGIADICCWSSLEMF